jgi:Permuted papain-like amidase enzyme, YaeF/YiiX, C92 family
MRFLKRLSLGILGVIAILAVTIFSWLSFTAVSAADLPSLQNGDIVFQTSHSSQSTAVSFASRSVYSHTGIVELDASGNAFIEEATGPVQLTAIDDWIKQGIGGRIMIKRLEGLLPQQAKDILSAAHKYDGLPYDIFFLPDKEHIYCSELVRLAFEEGSKIEVGKIQTVRELDVDGFLAQRLIKSRWAKHPLCQATGETFEKCYPRILNQTLVTPASIAEDPRMKTIFSNYGALAN